MCCRYRSYGRRKNYVNRTLPPVHFHVCIANTGLSWGYPTYVLQTKDLARMKGSGSVSRRIILDPRRAFSGSCEKGRQVVDARSPISLNCSGRKCNVFESGRVGDLSFGSADLNGPTKSALS